MGIETVHTGDGRSRLRSYLPLGAALVTVVLWASAFVAIRHLGSDVSPGALTLGRLLVGSAVLGALLISRPRRWPTRRDWPPLLVVGLLWFGVYNVALNAGEQRVDAGTASMLVNVGPIIVAVLAAIFLGEGFPRRVLGGTVVGFAGVVIIALSTSPSGQNDMWGVVLCVVAAASAAVSMIAQKPLVGRLPALEVTWLACTIGAVACLPFAPELIRDVDAAGGSAIVWIVYLGAFPTAVAFTTWAYALARSTAGRLASTIYLVPPITIVLGWALLDEIPPVVALGGGALCLLGVAVSRTQGRRREPRARPAG